MEQTKLAQSLSVAYQPHPIAPLYDRKGMVAVTDGTATVRDVLLSTGIDPRQPITVQLDGRLLTVDEWDEIIPTQSQLLSVTGTVQGGGGGSNALQIVAVVAIAVAAAVIAGPVGAGFMASTFGVSAGTAATMAAVAGAVVAVGGSLLIGAIFAPKPPTMPNALPQVSPTYSLSGGQNRSRPYEPMPVVMGTHRLFLDYASRPFTEYRGNDQYLYQIFSLGLGNITASDYKIGTTDITSYSDYEFVTPDADGKLQNFPGNVDTAAGAALTNSGGAVTRTTSTNTTQIGIDLEGTLFFASDDGNLESRSVDIKIETKLTSSGVYGFPELTIYGDNATYNQSNGILTITGSSQKPMRLTLLSTVESDQYDVRLTRLTADSTSTREQTVTSWSVLRSYQEDDSDYKGQNRVGLIIKATEQLNGIVQQLSATVTAQATYWNGSAFVTGATSNPAHWFTHFARGVYNADGKLMYGIGLSDSQIDLPSLVSWANFCSTEGLTFNAVIDSTLTAADVLTMIGTAGFGSPTWASGKLGVVFDSRNASPVMAFGMANIIRDSFEVAYISENLADEIVVRFSNPAKDYEQDEVRVLAPDVVTATRTSAIDLFGCTDADMAGKFANYIAAQQFYRRRRVTWQSDFEGFVCQRGDVVLLSHDLTQWGYSGRLVGVDSNIITLDRSVPRQDQIEYLMLIRPDGTTTTYDVAATTDDESDTLTVVNDIFTLQSGANLIDHRWAFSPLETPGKKLKILSVQPASDARLQIVATDELSEFYDAWDGTFVAPVADTILPAQAVAVTNLTATNRVAFVNGYLTNRVALAWNVSGSTLYSAVKIYLDGNLIRDVAESAVPYVETDISGGGTFFAEVTPYGVTGAGLTQTTTLALSTLDLPAPPTTVTLDVGEDGKAATFTWTPVLGVQSYVIEVFANSATRRSVNVGNTLSYTYTLEQAESDGGAFRSYNFRVYSVNQAGQSSTFAEALFSNPQIGQLQNASIEPMPNSLWFNADKPTDKDFAAIKVWISKTQGFTPSAATLAHDGADSFVTISADADGNPLESGVVYYLRAAGHDTFGDDNLTLTAELSTTILSPAWGLIADDIDRSVLESGLRDEIEDGTTQITNIQNKYTVKINNSGHISGYGLISTENNATPTSEFIVVADRFAIAPVATNPDAVDGSPFFVLTADTDINGVTVAAGTYMKQAFIYDAEITTAKINDLAVTNAKIANLAVTNAKIEDASITTAKIENAAITTAKIEDATITSAKIEDAAIGSAKIEDAAVTNAKIGAAAITAAKIEDATITGAKIADATIENAKIADATIESAKIKDAAITNAKIDNAAVTSAKIEDAAITSAKIGSAAITTAKIGDAEITTAKIGTAQVDTLRIAGNSVTTTLGMVAGSNSDVTSVITLNQPGLLHFIANKTDGSEFSRARIYLNGTLLSTITGADYDDPSGIQRRSESTKVFLALGNAGNNNVRIITDDFVTVTLVVLAALR